VGVYHGGKRIRKTNLTVFPHLSAKETKLELEFSRYEAYEEKIREVSQKYFLKPSWGATSRKQRLHRKSPYFLMTASLVPHLTHLILLFPYGLSFGGFVDGTEGKRGPYLKF
jgi:hypothetical protein